MDKNKAKEIILRLARRYPDPKPKLKFKNNFELLVAVILSAQCTDERVNKVTEKLFEKYDTPAQFAEMKHEELERYIYSCGLYKNKAKFIISASKDIVEKYGGEVPSEFTELKKLSGVGVKTANVVCSVGFGKDALAVDTHVFRVSNRLGLSKSKDVKKCEEELKEIIDKSEWSKAHHYLIFYGREVCRAIKPDCAHCELSDLCEKNFKVKKGK